MNTENFILESRKIHGDKYDYSKTVYVNATTKVCIICPIHGEFWIIPNKHLKRKQGCSACSKNRKLTVEEFIRRAREVHGDKYNYSKVVYVNMHTKVCIICPIHGEFWQRPCDHLIQKSGCYECKGVLISSIVRKDTNWFIQKANKVHNGKYIYTKSEYINSRIPLCIICPEHGEFWQKPNDHLDGCGCSKCKQSHLENIIENIFNQNNIKFDDQRKFKWLKNKSSLVLDFYLPQYNIAIECQGKQHFIEVSQFGGKDGLVKTQHRDQRKRQLCKENGVELIYFLDKKFEDYVKDLDNRYFTNVDDLLLYIKEKEELIEKELMNIV